MTLFDWTFNWFNSFSKPFSQIAVVFGFCDLIVSTFFRIAFASRLRLRIRYHGYTGSYVTNGNNKG